MSRFAATLTFLVLGTLSVALSSFGEIPVQTNSCQTALLIIDVQQAWVGGAAKTIDGVLIQQKTHTLSGMARGAGVPVVFVMDVAHRHRFTDEELELVPPLEILEGDILSEKEYTDAFLFTSLADTLRSIGVSTVLVTGYASDECVAQTVIGALGSGFEVIIVADGHSAGVYGLRARQQNAAWDERGLKVVHSSDIDFNSLCGCDRPAVDEAK